jgi:photosystem II stability/assembly factor-like uncharacterized protein
MTLKPLPRSAALLFALALFLAAASAAHAGVNVWTSIGPNGGPVWSLAIDPSAPTTLYAGGQGGVWKSVDGGASWTLTSRGLGNPGVTELALDPRQPAHLFASNGYDLLFRSTDGATTWQSFPGDPAGGFTGFTSLVADPQSPLTLYASASPGFVWRSTDGGKSWQKRSDRSFYGLSLLADPQHPGTLYAATATREDVLRSTDGGATWTDRSAGLPPLTDDRGAVAIALDPEVPTTLYAVVRITYGEPAALYVSRDAGAHWQPDGPGGFPLATGPGGAVYAGSARSLDHGQTWTTVPTLGDGVEYRVSPTAGTTVYASSSTGVYRSTDGAASWQLIVNGLAATPISAVAVRPALPTVLLAGVDHVGILRGRPSGQSWRTGTGVFHAAQQILFDPANPAVAYAQGSQEILRSTDSGLSWEKVAPPTIATKCDPYLQTLAVGPGALYAGFELLSAPTTCAQFCGIFKSVDQGESWTCLPLRAPFVRSLAVAPSSAGAVVYATERANLWKSTNGGATWTLLNRGWQRLTTILDLLVVDPTRADVLYMSSADGLLKSADGGRSWTTSGRGLPTDAYLSAVVIDPDTPTTLYAGLAFRGVYRSVDGGRRWSAQVGGLRGFSGALAIDPLHPETLYAGTPANGVYTITFTP